MDTTHNVNIPQNDPAEKSTSQARPPKPIPLAVIPEQIPPELKTLKQWLIWNYFYKVDLGYWDKPPLDANRSGNAGKSTDPKTWATFEQAVQSYQRGHYDGIGLALIESNGIVGFDLDECRDLETGKIAPWALTMIKQLPTYWEISPSGTGLRGFAYGRKPGSRCRAGDFEMYTHGRYLCLTGHHLEGTPPTIEPAQAGIDAVYAEMFPTQAHSSPNGHRPYADDDDGVIARLRGYKNAPKFCRLFDDGDTSEYGGDHSRADQGLCRLIAAGTDNQEQMDRLFRLSALYRTKWEREDYRQGTITKAIQHATEQWSPGQGHVADEEEPGYHSSEDGDEQKTSTDTEQPQDKHYKPIPPYLITWSAKQGNALYYQKPGTTDEQILANFMAWIVEERLEDDGAEPVRMVTLDATLITGKRFSDIRIPVPEFYNLSGILKALGTEAVVSPGPMVKDRIRHAIQLFSNRKTYPQRHVFTHLGWRQVDGDWCYLHAGGSIPSKAEVSVEKNLQRYVLPQVSSAQHAINASLRTLACAPARLTIPLFSLVYLAPLAHWLETDLTGWLEGESGARKSSLAALMMCHFGTFSRVHPPESWESTANNLERFAFLAKDTVLWIDDYAPQPSAKEAHEQERKAQRVIRAQGNLSGRGRMRADMTLRPQYYPRGIILSTGELHPTGTSTFARMLQLEVEKGDIRLDALSASQAESSLLAEAMAVYIEWLQPQLATLPTQLNARRIELRSQALPHLTHHTRHPDMYSHLAIGWELFLRFAQESGVLTEEERLLQWHVGYETLMQAINRQRLDAEAEDPVYRFCSHIKEALIQGKAYLDDVRGGYPDDAGQWGWSMQTIRHNDGTVSDEWKPSPGASMLGWIDNDFVYLLPDATYRLVFENLQRAGVTLLPQQTLWKRLIDRGYVQRGERRYTTQKRIGDTRAYVLKLVRRHVEGYLSPQSDDNDDNEDRQT